MQAHDSDAVLLKFLTPYAWECLSKQLKLSRREMQIVRAIFARKKESTIARSLRISPHTVHTYLKRLYIKLNVATRAELVAAVLCEFIFLTAERGSPLPSICCNRTMGRCPLCG